ncbi:hypothetical protein [Paenibacillus terrigena]|uniref:hypothetical protein n=1 Tax=Paenibacillus terrigena TaxID=369333 RepID=UPI0003753468|nr:hypothetical protein [Paenibacillus terrigena]
MKNLVGKQVMVYYGQRMQLTAQGTLSEWNEQEEMITLAPEGIRIPIAQIAKVELLEPVEARSELAQDPAYRSGNVRFVMHDTVQFDNAIYFQSPVSIWHKDRLICHENRIIHHTEHEVTIQGGTVFRKDECQFIVKSMIGIQHSSRNE